jgi:hypothetical protein
MTSPPMTCRHDVNDGGFAQSWETRRVLRCLRMKIPEEMNKIESMTCSLDKVFSLREAYF